MIVWLQTNWVLLLIILSIPIIIFSLSQSLWKIAKRNRLDK